MVCVRIVFISSIPIKICYRLIRPLRKACALILQFVMFKKNTQLGKAKYLLYVENTTVLFLCERYNRSNLLFYIIKLFSLLGSQFPLIVLQTFFRVSQSSYVAQAIPKECFTNCGPNSTVHAETSY